MVIFNGDLSMKFVLCAGIIAVAANVYARGRVSSVPEAIIKGKLAEAGISGAALAKGIERIMRFEIVMTYSRSYADRDNLRVLGSPTIRGEHYSEHGEYFHDPITPKYAAKRVVAALSTRRGDHGKVFSRSGNLLSEYAFRLWGDKIKVTKLPAIDLKSGNEVVISDYAHWSKLSSYNRNVPSDGKRSHRFQRLMQANMIGIDGLAGYADNVVTYRALVSSRLDALGMTKIALHNDFGSSSYDLTKSPPTPTYRDDLAKLSEILALDPAFLEEMVAIEYILQRYAYITHRPYDATGKIAFSYLPAELKEALQSALAVMQAVNTEDTGYTDVDALQASGESRFTEVFSFYHFPFPVSHVAK